MKTLQESLFDKDLTEKSPAPWKEIGEFFKEQCWYLIGFFEWCMGFKHTYYAKLFIDSHLQGPFIEDHWEYFEVLKNRFLSIYKVVPGKLPIRYFDNDNFVFPVDKTIGNCRAQIVTNLMKYKTKTRYNDYMIFIVPIQEALKTPILQEYVELYFENNILSKTDKIVFIWNRDKYNDDGRIFAAGLPKGLTKDEMQVFE